jgi:hypothetical protein
MSWKSVIRSRYNSMQKRKTVIALGGLPFTLDQFREHCLKYFGEEDGVVLCRYCRIPVYLGACAVDHAVPLGRGGSIGLENLEFPCQPCNDKKGQLTSGEFIALGEFLKLLPFEASQDVMSRLQKAVKLAAGKRWGLKKAAKA